MTVRSIIRKLLLIFSVATGLLSCENEPFSEIGKGLGSGNALVRLDVRIPGNIAPASRALLPQHEDEIGGIVVFAFEKGSDSQWNTKLRHVARSIGTPQGTGNTKQFMVELLSGEWDLWVLANSENPIHELEDILGVDIESKDFLGFNFDKSTLQTALTYKLSGKWDVYTNSPTHAYRIPMWGMLNAVQVENSSTNIIKTVNLYRMLAKVNVEVQRAKDAIYPDIYPGIPMEEFELTHVSLHNYNKSGRLIPGVTTADGNWTSPGGGFAFRTSLPAAPAGVYGWESNKRLEWSNANDFTTPGTALNGVIYTVEAERGTDKNNRPCIIIGGKYKGSNDITYYRADFLDTTTKKFLDLLRNHSYQLLIRKISGSGFSTIEEAYEAGPTNLETEVINWSEGGYLEGVWNGAHEIRLSETKVHFTQFGTPTEQVITIRTTLSALTLEGFTDITSGGADGNWQSITTNQWSNGHFNVKIEKVATVDKYSDYALTITAAPTESGNPARQSTFIIKGNRLEAKMSISQDEHAEYQLKLSPDPSLPISIGGKRQFIEVEVESRYPYAVDFKNTTMFLNVYEEVAGVKQVLHPAYIPANVTKIYIEVDSYSAFESRLGEFLIRHAYTESTAIPRIYRVLQTSGIIMSVLKEGGYSTTIPKAGGSATIAIYSNLAAWSPVLTINGVPYTGKLSKYFNVTNGFQTMFLDFTAPAMAASETTEKVYSITFKDIEGIAETTQPITITQRGSSITPPTVGIRAPKNILVVNAKGELNLDGDGYIVYFKWGSLVGISGSSEVFNSSQIAWAPAEYDISVIGNSWEKVEYTTTNGNQLPATTPATGFGDPCTLAYKDGVKGKWMMPTNPWPDPLSTVTGWTEYTIEGEKVKGRLNHDGSMFYPAAGKRTSGQAPHKEGINGYYWINYSTSSTVGSAFYFSETGSTSAINRGRAEALPIRCVPKK